LYQAKRQWGRFFSEYFSFPLSISPVLHTHIQLHVAVIRRNSLEAFQKGMLFQKSSSTGEKSTSAFFFSLQQVKVILKRTMEELFSSQHIIIILGNSSGSTVVSCILKRILIIIHTALTVSLVLICKSVFCSLTLSTPQDGDILIDYSKNRINDEVFSLLVDLVSIK